MSKMIFWLLVCFALGYLVFLGIKVTKIKLDYSSVKAEAQRLFSPSSNCPYQEVPNRLLKKAQEQQIPLKEEDIDLYVDDWEGVRVLSFAYYDSLSILKIKTVIFDFTFSDTVYFPGRK